MQNQSAYLRAFRQRLFSGKVKPQQVFHELQAFGQYQEIASVARLFASPTNPFHRFLYGMPFAKTYAEVHSRPLFTFTDDLERELNWLSISIIRYARDSELTPYSYNTSFYAALRVFAIFTFTLCSTWFVMTRNRSAC